MTARVPWSRLLPPAAFAAAFALLAWVVLSHHPYAVDTGPHRWSVDHRPHAAAVAARLVTDTGTGVFPPLVAALGGWLAGLAAYGGGPASAKVAAAGDRAARMRRAVPMALLALVVLLAGQAVRTGLMAALRRGRPPVADWAVHASGHSFPSGHTSSSAIAAGLLTWGLLRLRPDRAPGFRGLRARWPAVLCCLVAVAVGCSRMYLGVHWPTDVLGGWLFAGFWLAVTLPLLTYVADGRDTREDGDTGQDGDTGEAGDDRGTGQHREGGGPQRHGREDQTDTP